MVTAAPKTANPRPGVVLICCGRIGSDGRPCTTKLFDVWFTDEIFVRPLGAGWSSKSHWKGPAYTGLYQPNNDPSQMVIDSPRWTVKHRCYRRREPTVSKAFLVRIATVARESGSQRTWLADAL